MSFQEKQLNLAEFDTALSETLILSGHIYMYKYMGYTSIKSNKDKTL